MVTEQDPDFENLLRFLKEQRGFDFTGYKRPSLMRRVQRRMEALDIEGFEDYHDFLALHPQEFTALFNTILINVTGFFRDRDSWTYLQEEILPDLLARRDGQPMRVWSAGCASGEEAYTLAMVLAEVMGIDDFVKRVKIYATDVDEEALTVARQASYTDREVDGVPEELLERYFERHGQRFMFRKELRRTVIFGRNDLVQDAPISHVDVLACRNTLMYFNAETQAQILQRIHFALRPDGVLFLGKAEMLLGHANLFKTLEIRRRFFRKVTADPRIPRPGTLRGAVAGNGSSDDSDPLRHAALMSSAAAQLVLDTDGRLVLANNGARTVFGLSARDLGRPIQDLEVSYRPVELRAHLDQVQSEGRTLWLREVVWNRPSAEPLTFDIQFVPLGDGTGNRIGTTIIFADVSQHLQLQHELEHANRQLETAYEELQSTNEELETTNEELQSTNEELETMNEELQSMNDELHVSSESQREQQEHYYQLNRFLASVLASLNAGVVAVDDELRVLAWNARAEDLWGIRADEARGQHLFALDIGLPLEPLRPGLKRQLTDQVAPEVLRLDAVNRRGRSITVQVTLSKLAHPEDDGTTGALLTMDVVDG
ncbi:MAG TPA: CheR family methyltransferase [Marmoricola sp.]|nr:CheR family methyltransferase [Marmoricola sp.]